MKMNRRIIYSVLIILSLLCMFIAPIAAIIPAAATSSALIYVGILMMSGVKNGTYDRTVTSVFVGSHGATEMPTAYGIMSIMRIGVVT